MKSKRCEACGGIFHPRPQTPQQEYCAASTCQRERRRRWQQLKLQSDPDYRDNQTRAQKTWRENNPDYSREYRSTHPEYAERNRMLQRDRNRRKLEREIAKMDASNPLFPFSSGIYRIEGTAKGPIANKYSWIVKITLVSEEHAAPKSDCKERT